MDRANTLFLINGEDKTESIGSCRYENGRYSIVFFGTPKEYTYHANKIEVLNLQNTRDPNQVIPVVQNEALSNVRQIQNFGRYYRIVFSSGAHKVYPAESVKFQNNCLHNRDFASLFEYFKATAEAIGLTAKNGSNILGMQYDRISQISSETVLSCFLDRTKEIRQLTPPETLIYPFGLNQSQKIAVENAFSSQVSIIQGPPGTGKTQTILNIIANAVRNNQTVAVVSNNNSATLNVAEKLEKKELGFLTAFLGSLANKAKFLENQNGTYPDMSSWALDDENKTALDRQVSAVSAELNRMLDMKNRMAAIEQELLQLNPEQQYFKEYYETYSERPDGSLLGLSSQKLLNLWAEYEAQQNSEKPLGFLKKLSVLLRYNRSAWKRFGQSPELMIPYLQHQFYMVRKAELEEERADLQKQLERYAFEDKIHELTEKSLQLFRHQLSQRYSWSSPRQTFEQQDFRRNSSRFNAEYPVILSTTYSIKGTLSVDHLYDYLIIDEASQVDLATGVLALASARNVVIVGDLKQLPHVMTSEKIHTAEMLWNRHPFDPCYRYSRQSLLSSALAVWKDAPTVLLREHYRCHPKIIHFCNQKFYDGELIVMTEDHHEPDALTLFRTVPGNHTRGHMNQRQIPGC